MKYNIQLVKDGNEVGVKVGDEVQYMTEELTSIALDECRRAKTQIESLQRLTQRLRIALSNERVERIKAEAALHKYKHQDRILKLLAEWEDG